jgi:predicted flap endonuclease-1-like 5' DNA nuclease
MDVLIANWPLALIAVLLALLLLLVLLRRGQRVVLTDSSPIRPHMAVGRKGEGKGLGDEAAAAAADVAGPIINARVHDSLPGASGPPDDLVKLKGIGPKLALLLNQHGIARFDQIAKLSPGQVETLDADLGAFRGRLARDQVVEQADYLARGDIDGFEQRFGKL